VICMFLARGQTGKRWEGVGGVRDCARRLFSASRSNIIQHAISSPPSFLTRAAGRMSLHNSCSQHRAAYIEPTSNEASIRFTHIHS
jgi:hypothetical protein